MAAPATAAVALAQVAPPLYARGEAVYQPWLDDATLQIAATGWGDHYAKAIALLAAHQWLRLTGGTVAGLTPTAAEAVGAISGEGADGRNRSYANPALTGPLDAELATTRYGLAFLSLRRSRYTYGARLAV